MSNDLIKAENKNDAFSARQIATARHACEEFGGPDAVLERLAEGISEIDLAQEIGIPLLSLKAYIRNSCDPSSIEEARSAFYDRKFHDIGSEARLIPDEAKRVKALFDLTTYQADKETLKYRDKKNSDQASKGISISIDWQAIAASPATPLTIDIIPE